MFPFQETPSTFSSRFDGAHDGGREREKLHGGKSVTSAFGGRRLDVRRQTCDGWTELVRDPRITGLHLLERKDRAGEDFF
jgi:hypothetical protein